MVDQHNLLECGFAFGGPCGSADLRVMPEDFIVEEELGFEPSGEGEHLLLWVEKIGQNTTWVAKQLARQVGVNSRDVSFSGMKDRHAVTRQWFSLPLRMKSELPENIDIEGVEILSMTRHGRKLKRGTHKFNRFEITLRNVKLDKDIVSVIDQIKENGGVPNLFGEQRFGHENLSRVQAWFDGSAKEANEMPDRKEKSFLLSSARSHLFNLILAKRIEVGNWNTPMLGEWLMLNGSNSGFVFDKDDKAITQRLKDVDIHCSALMTGAGEDKSSADCLALEQAALTEFALWQACLAENGLKNQRRALRMPVYDFDCIQQEDTVVLKFRLSAGCFATAVLRELVSYVDVQKLQSDDKKKELR